MGPPNLYAVPECPAAPAVTLCSDPLLPFPEESTITVLPAGSFMCHSAATVLPAATPGPTPPHRARQPRK